MADACCVGARKHVGELLTEGFEIEMTVGIDEPGHNDYMVCVGRSEFNIPANNASILLRATPESFSLN